MAAPKGNNFYKLRDVSGRPRIFDTPIEVVKEFNNYVDFVDKNPFKEDKVFANEGSTHHGHQKRMRVMSIDGFCTFAGMIAETFREYEKREDFTVVFNAIRQNIETSQFEASSANLVNANIMARKLGLIDQVGLKENTVTIKVEDPTGKLNNLMEGIDE